MDWFEIIKSVAIVALVAFVFLKAIEHAHGGGVEDGTMLVLKLLCEGEIVLEDGKLIISENCPFAFYNMDGKRMDEMKVEDLKFTID